MWCCFTSSDTFWMQSSLVIYSRQRNIHSLNSIFSRYKFDIVIEIERELVDLYSPIAIEKARDMMAKRKTATKITQSKILSIRATHIYTTRLKNAFLKNMLKNKMETNAAMTKWINIEFHCSVASAVVVAPEPQQIFDVIWNAINLNEQSFQFILFCFVLFFWITWSVKFNWVEWLRWRVFLFFFLNQMRLKFHRLYQWFIHWSIHSRLIYSHICLDRMCVCKCINCIQLKWFRRLWRSTKSKRPIFFLFEQKQFKMK